MRIFIVLCLAAIVGADKLGYNYQPVPHSDTGLSFQPGGGGGGGGVSYGEGSLGVGGSYGGGSNGVGSYASSSDLSGNIGGGSSYSAPAAGLEKQFYTFTAPEGEFDDQAASQKIANSVKQGLRVIFIKGPENKGLENAALALAKQASEQKTAIYVLNKQADIGDLANKLNAVRNDNQNKPEVHFVKYRTPEDAANAQRQIQSQYDSLGGSSQSHNGGVAPVLNFASQPQVQRGPAPQAPVNSYLPASIFRRRL